MNAYEDFLATKRRAANDVGFTPNKLPARLFDWQKDIVEWACKKGRAAIFADCGLGKSLMELAWGQLVCEHVGESSKVILLTPLAVAQQMKREGEKFGIPVTVCRTAEDVRPGINVTNYEKLDKFESAPFDGVILDESSILKNFTGATKQALIERFIDTEYKLACTATPAPNDHVELGNHAEFLGIMSRLDMLAEYFCHDGGDTSKWRLKGHAQDVYWEFVASWAVTVRMPSDLGYSNDGYDLPRLETYDHMIDFRIQDPNSLFDLEATGLTDQRTAKRASIMHRVEKVGELVAKEPDESWLIWCELNDEGDALEKLIPGSVQVSGGDKDEFKVKAIEDFISGKIKILISKSTMFGFGLNLQHCSRIAFGGVSNSYEQTYQAIRRCWRFGQKRNVHCHFVYAPAEKPILMNLRRKEEDARHMSAEMVRRVQMANGMASSRIVNERIGLKPMTLPKWLGR